MVEIRKEVLETMLQDYKPLYRFLKGAEYEPKLRAEGVFKTTKDWFFEGRGNFNHFTDAERIFCFNQLGYVLLAEAFEKGHVPDAPTIGLSAFYKLQKDSSYIVGSDNIRYKKPIISTAPFKGKIQITDGFKKRNGELLFLDIAYDFEDGKATGRSRVCLVLRDLEGAVND
jgi:hypothetical protein